METRSHRDRRRHLPPVHLRARDRPDRLHVQPVPDRRRAAVAVPHRSAGDVPAREPRRSRRSSRSSACGGSPSVTSSPTSAASMNQLPRRRARRRGRARRHGLHGVAERPVRPAAAAARRRRGARARARTGSVTSTRRTSPTAGRHACSTTRRRTRCFAGDLFSNLGDPAPLTTDDIVGAASQAEDMFGATCLTPNTAPTIRRLAELAPTTIAVMHGSSFSGDGAAALHAAGGRLRGAPDGDVDARRMTVVLAEHACGA